MLSTRLFVSILLLIPYYDLSFSIYLSLSDSLVLSLSIYFVCSLFFFVPLSLSLYVLLVFLLSLLLYLLVLFLSLSLLCFQSLSIRLLLLTTVSCLVSCCSIHHVFQSPAGNLVEWLSLIRSVSLIFFCTLTLSCATHQQTNASSGLLTGCADPIVSCRGAHPTSSRGWRGRRCVWKERRMRTRACRRQRSWGHRRDTSIS